MNREEKHTDVLPTESARSEAVGDPAPADPAPDLIDLLKTAETEAAEMKDAWLRARADIENIRKQGANDVARAGASTPTRWRWRNRRARRTS